MPITPAQLDEYNAKGFARVPGFLTAQEIEWLREDFQKASGVSVRSYGVKDVSPECVTRIQGRLLETSREVSAGTATETDMVSGAVYWSSSRSKAGVTDSWHQDHDSWWLWGRNHVDYLHLYLPIIKPDSDKTGISFVPFDRLGERSPKAHELVVEKGAMACKRRPGSTLIYSRDTGRRERFDFDIEEIAESPPLAEGDLLLFRGDVLHRTQDRQTDRVAVSFCMANSRTTVHRDHMLSWGSTEKLGLMMSNHEKYRYVLEALAHHGDGCELGKVQAYLDASYQSPAAITRSALLRAKIRTASSQWLRRERSTTA